jgi:Terminase large subunit, T4likevirus-type, N-terminal
MLGRDLGRYLDPALFAADCNIRPDAWQADLLRTMPRRALLLCSRQSGKSTATALAAAHTAVYQPGALVVIVSPSQRQSAEMLRTCRNLLTKLEGGPRFDSESVLKIELENKSRIIALPASGDTIRGMAGAALVVIDEASRVADEMLSVVRPMVATSNGAIIALTTPNGKRGWFHAAWHDGDPLWHRVRVPASECPRITQQFLDEERKALGPTRFAEEYGLEFVDSVMSAFPTTLIEQMFTNEVLPLWN